MSTGCLALFWGFSVLFPQMVLGRESLSEIPATVRHDTSTAVLPADLEIRGIYVNARMAGSHRVRDLVDRLVAAGGNALVFDVKDRRGDLGYRSQVELAREIGADEAAPIRRPVELIDFLHERGVRAVARLVCFYDARLAKARPDLVPLSRKDWGLWSERDEPTWVDPSLPEVQDYLLALVREVAAMGADEIQLDYLRFPTEGDVEDALFAFDPEVLPRYEVIASFLERVHSELDSTGVLLAADLFGVVAWGRKVDEMNTGQKLSALLPYLDVVCPMLYPSHFYGRFDRIPRPVDYPYFVVYRGCSRMQRLAQRYGVVVRPWIQAFPYRVACFDEQYVTEQLYGARDGGAQGWMLWNSAGRYEVGLSAIESFVNASADSLSAEERFPKREAAADPQEKESISARPPMMDRY